MSVKRFEQAFGKALYKCLLLLLLLLSTPSVFIFRFLENTGSLKVVEVDVFHLCSCITLMEY